MFTEKGWFKNEKEQELESIVKEHQKEKQEIIKELSEEILSMIEKIDDKLKAPVLSGPEKIESSLPQLQKDISTAVERLLAETEQYAIFSISLQQKMHEFKNRSKHFLRSTQNLGENMSAHEWEPIMDDFQIGLIALTNHISEPIKESGAEFSNN